MSKEMEKTTNPYVEARREWNERYGSYIAQAKNWRIAAIISLLISVISVGGLAYIGSTVKIKPYIVMVDELGQSATHGYMPEYKPNKNVVKFAVVDFISSLRTVYPDNEIQRDHIYNVYKYLAGAFPASGVVDEFYKSNPPFGKKFSQKVEVTNIIETRPDQWQIDWSERRYDDSGNPAGMQKFRAIADVVFKEPTTEEQVLKNPTGLYIKNITISKILD
ncbi:MAG: VirB8/TrbF family protein [Sulfurovum sp.]